METWFLSLTERVIMSLHVLLESPMKNHSILEKTTREGLRTDTMFDNAANFFPWAFAVLGLLHCGVTQLCKTLNTQSQFPA